MIRTRKNAKADKSAHLDERSQQHHVSWNSQFNLHRPTTLYRCFPKHTLLTVCEGVYVSGRWLAKLICHSWSVERSVLRRLFLVKAESERNQLCLNRYALDTFAEIRHSEKNSLPSLKDKVSQSSISAGYSFTQSYVSWGHSFTVFIPWRTYV